MVLPVSTVTDKKALKQKKGLFKKKEEEEDVPQKVVEKPYHEEDMEDEEPTCAALRPHWERFKLLPWLTLIATCLFVPGLIVWSVNIKLALNLGTDFVDLLGATSAQKASFNSQTRQVYLGVIVGGAVAVTAALVLALVQLGHHWLLRGYLGVTARKPEPQVFRTYRFLNGVMAVIMWLLLAVAAALLMLMLLLWGISSTVNTAIAKGTDVRARIAAANMDINTFDDSISNLVYQNKLLLNSAPTCAIGSSWLKQVDMAMMSPYGQATSSTPSVGDVPPFQAYCPTSCLNLGSFGAVVEYKQTCICGALRLVSLQAAAQTAMSSALAALGGAAAMYLACTLFLASLSAQAVSAMQDMQEAEHMKEAWEEQYENGFRAESIDCTYATPSTKVSASGKV